MDFIALDCETTGLNPKSHQVLEIGAVSVINNVITDNTFHAIILHKTLVGQPYALAMNHKIIKESIDHGVSYDEAMGAFNAWVKKIIMGYSIDTPETYNRALFAGKNFGSFDLQFLKDKLEFKYNHRFLDPAMLFLSSEDMVPPDLATCAKRAGINDIVTHTALEDAMLTAKIVLIGLKTKIALENSRVYFA